VAQRYHLEVEGRTYLVEVEDPFASPAVVRVNGREFRVAWRPAEEGASAGAGASSAAEKPAGGLAGDLSLRAVTAPMPGTILDIRVQPGDEVAFQQELCSLEAMKMKNSIRSPRAGRIAEVRVAEGQTVAYGDVLFTFA
jgi:biotin carboxyl carrier protein